MVKKLFALASVTALTGLVSTAGCTSEEVVPAPGATEDSGVKDAAKAVKDTAPPDPEEDATVEPTCLSTDPIDASKLPYKNAKVGAAGTCDADDLGKINKYIEDLAANESVSIAKWTTAIGKKDCSDCVFGTADGATWTPIITKADKLQTVNRGGCIQIVSGSEACGQAYQQFFACELVACGQCKTQAEFDACRKDGQAIFTGPCKGALTAIQTDCDETKLEGWEEACKGTGKYTFEGSIQAQCITGGVVDGG